MLTSACCVPNIHCDSTLRTPLSISMRSHRCRVQTFIQRAARGAFHGLWRCAPCGALNIGRPTLSYRYFRGPFASSHVTRVLYTICAGDALSCAGCGNPNPRVPPPAPPAAPPPPPPPPAAGPPDDAVDSVVLMGSVIRGDLMGLYSKLPGPGYQPISLQISRDPPITGLVAPTTLLRFGGRPIYAHRGGPGFLYWATRGFGISEWLVTKREGNSPNYSVLYLTDYPVRSAVQGNIQKLLGALRNETADLISDAGGQWQAYDERTASWIAEESKRQN